MKLEDIRARLRDGETIMATMIEGRCVYALAGGKSVRPSQFQALREEMSPVAPDLTPDSEPQQWALRQ